MSSASHPHTAPESYSVEATSAALADFTERIMAAERQKAVDHMAAADITVSQIRMLLALMHHGELASHQLADEVELSLAAVTRAADRLVATNLVQRREDPSDRRVKLLSLTDSGQEMLDTQFRIRDRQLHSVVSQLPDELRNRLGSAISDALAYLPQTDSHPGCHLSAHK